MQKTLIFLDTETTGNTPTDRLCQLCYRAWRDDAMITELNELYLPPVPISVGSQAVHHIRPKMVADRPAFQDSPEYADIKSLLESSDSIIVAHNAPFDLKMLALEGIFPQNYIDTLKLIRHIDPDMDMERHSLQYSRYYLNLDDLLPDTVVIQAHDALGDVLILEHLYQYLADRLRQQYPDLDEQQFWDKLFAISREPALIGKITFGKYAGKLVRDLAIEDRGYLEWLLNAKRKNASEGADETDWIATLEHALGIKTLFN